MDKILVVSLALVIGFALAPTVSAETTTPCGDVADESDVTVPLDGNTTFYANLTDLEVWQENNTFEGLQREAGTCVDENGREVAYDADASLLALPPEPPVGL